MLPLTNWKIGEYRILRLVTGGAWIENCYIVTHMSSGDQALIDPGGNPDDIERFMSDSGERLRHVLLTHAHFDHVGAAAAICRQSQLKCRIHKDDVRLLRHAPMYAEVFIHENIEMPTPVEPFETGTALEFGARNIVTVHTPGHTRGSVCYLFPGFAFTGDTLLRKSVGRTDLPGGDPKLLMVSVAQLVETLPDHTVLFPGHGPEWVVGDARAWWSDLSFPAPQFPVSS